MFKLPHDSRGLPCLPLRRRPAHVQDMLDRIKKDGDYHDNVPKHYMLPEHGREYALLEYIGGLERLLDRERVGEQWVVSWTSPVGAATEEHETREEALKHARELRASAHGKRGPVGIKHVTRYRVGKGG